MGTTPRFVVGSLNVTAANPGAVRRRGGFLCNGFTRPGSVDGLLSLGPDLSAGRRY
jgi:hypothetical protein